MNTGWKNESFRGYADYMQTTEFAAEVDWLVRQPELGRLIVMCAEAVPWRCHRSLIADAVMVRGVEVQDVFVSPQGEASLKPHEVTKFARVEGNKVWYPPEGRLI